MKHKLLLLTLSLFFSISAFSQYKLLEKTSEVGMMTGSSSIIGDIESMPSLGIGIYAKKYFNDFFALRATIFTSTLKGRDYKVISPFILSNTNIAALGYTSFVNNYQTRFYDLTVEPTFFINANNIEFYASLAPNFHWYRVSYDAFDENGDYYDYSLLETAIAERGDIDQSDAKIVDQILDGDYETPQLLHPSEGTSSLGLNIVLGMNYRISPKFSLGIDARLLLSLEDNLDGYKVNKKDRFDKDKLFSLSLLATYIIE